MSEISRVALFGQLNPLAYKSIESATVFCKMRGNPYVELVHWIAQLVQAQGTDLEALIRHYQIDASMLKWRTMRCRSLSCVCRICASQWTSST